MLLIGSIPVHFKVVPGSFEDYKNMKISEAEFTEEAVTNLLKYKRPIVHALDENGEIINEKQGTYLPCIPNLDLAVNQFEGESEVDQTGQRLSQVLVKCKEDVSDTSSIKGFASGKRSAILVDLSDNSFIRLKGCGNLDEGFPLEPICEMMLPDSDEVRGCQFANTVYRELHYQQKLN